MGEVRALELFFFIISRVNDLLTCWPGNSSQMEKEEKNIDAEFQDLRKTMQKFMFICLGGS